MPGLTISVPVKSLDTDHLMRFTDVAAALSCLAFIALWKLEHATGLPTCS